ncbi:MAG: 1-deoxy-D-xylulose-5-phosphate synthase [Planctomycetota bacterium]
MHALPLLDSLLGPADLRRLEDGQLEQLAEEIRYRIKETVSDGGGHLSSNLGVVELTLALHRCFDFSADRLLWDVGHQAYVHKLLTGRARQIASLRQRDGLSGFPDPQESPFDLAKVGHSSTAISTGVGLAEGFRRRGQRRKTVVVVGDGALTGGMAFEGLINAGELDGDLLVVLNDNGAFIDAPVGSLHTYLNGIRTGSAYQRWRRRVANLVKRLPYGREVGNSIEHAVHRLLVPGHMFEDLGLRYYGPVDGHDRAALEQALETVQAHRDPVLLHVITRKGGGWQPSLEDPLAFHGPKHFDIETGKFRKLPGSTRIYANVLADSLSEIADEDDRLVAVTAAMPSGTGLRSFAQRHPDRCYDVGICEQHSFAFVQGLRLAGLRPVLAHYSTFAQRGYDQLFQEVVVQRDLGLVITLDRAGLVGEDGETHHGLYDIAWSRALPGTVLMAPKDGEELRAMLRWAYAQADFDGRRAAYLIRYPKEAVPALHWGLEASAPIAMGQAETIVAAEPDTEADRLLVWAYGAGVRLAWQALQELAPTEAARVSLVNARFAKPVDRDLLCRLAPGHQALLTVEDHSVMGGFGSAVLETCAAAGIALPTEIAGVEDVLVPHATREQQLAGHGLDPVALAGRMRRLLGVQRKTPLRMPDVG